jgi:hypothetical protein
MPPERNIEPPALVSARFVPARTKIVASLGGGPPARVGVGFGVLKQTFAPFAGTPAGLQLEPVLQSLLVVPVQVFAPTGHTT